MRRPLRPHPPARAAALGLAVALAALAAGCSQGSAPASSPPSAALQGAPLPASLPAPGFSLHDQDGGAVALAHYRGRVVVLAFVYTRCGAPCVLIAQQVRGALDQLGAAVPVLFVSVDPAGDTPARISRFLAQASLSGRVRYLNGPRATLAAVWRGYRVTPPGAGREAFARAAFVALVDRRGDERVLFGQEQLTPEALAHDIRKLQAG
jgi:protein SCO1/2